MKHLSLAARYRPQNFAQVAGQDMVKAVLSRAAAEDRPAAAYLLSGTRGVGKTTIARIFAKALNCEHAPGPEPCNQCEQCRKITQGVHVDVTEIDGASNNSVEDARSLRETIGYAPMEGRYKVFIIDEAHMLTRNAFNALLKTLEEPPERVVFIFATTEAHKFPITIVSRCQHFVFRHLGEDALAEHLSAVLRKEETEFEEGAVRLIARRAAGSVRDGMSLLDQTLALGGDRLTVETTRQVLGLAGQELFSELFDALHGQDCAAVAALCRRILQQGVDIGFFTRELAGNLRNLFLLRQGGPGIAPSLRLPADETALWQELAPRFSAAHLHAAWQMALDAQRGIVQSPEPAAALELLLLNLALLPRLLPVGQAPLSCAAPSPAAPGTPPPPPARPSGAMPPPDGARAQTEPTKTAPNIARPHRNDGSTAQHPPAGPRVAHAAHSAAADREEAETDDADAHPASTKPAGTPAPVPASPKETRTDAAAPSPAPGTARAGTSSADSATAAAATPPKPDADPDAPQQDHRPETQSSTPTPAAPRDWAAFCDFCAARQEAGQHVPPAHLLRGVPANWTDDGLRLKPKAEMQVHQLERQREDLLAALEAYGAGRPALDILPPRPYRPEAELIEEFSRRPELQDCLEVLNARVKGCRPADDEG
ncbi:MAG: DNA polymerase III subunit gamma/tau [Desulfovibrio desulfuricans]|jgi:DNA polymerase-3 subunit gamma/tau|nr:DNA polymerase III subunit gamma/tau [Desulfovibrio desulfuricans]